VAARLARRRAGRRPSDLLVLAHGRAGGVAPAELSSLVDELARRRGGRVFLQVLTDPDGPGPGASAGAPAPLTLVPLFLLPGEHVRHDVAAVAAAWRNRGWPLRRLPFLGAWPAWQQALADEVRQLRQAASSSSQEPQLLHHPLEGPLAPRYLDHLARVSGAQLRATPYSAEQLAELQLSLTAPAVPLALAANRLTDQLADRVGPPLLERPRFRQVLLEQLVGLP